MDSASGVISGMVLAFVVLPAAFVAAALGTPVIAGLLGYFAGRRAGGACTLCAGLAALFAVGAPLAVYCLAQLCLDEQSLIQTLMTSSAFLLKLPTYPFDGMYDRQAYGAHVLAASSSAIFAVVWIAGAAICVSRRGRAARRN